MFITVNLEGDIMKKCISNHEHNKVIVRKLTRVFDDPNIILRIVILTSFALMILGLLGSFVQQGSITLPGPSTTGLSGVGHVSKVPLGLLSMSMGLLLFVLIPSLRVLFGLEKFIRRREILNAIVALIVLVELTISIIL